MNTTTTQSKRIVTLLYDHDGECPSDHGTWKLVSFCSRHAAFEHPDNYFAEPSIGFRRRLECGYVHVLSCYQHGGIVWSLKGEGPQCPWDTVQVAGLLIWQGSAREMRKHYPTLEERRNYARSFLQQYTAWANGECYGYVIENEKGDHLDSCFGFVSDADTMFDQIREYTRGHEVEIRGDAKWLANYQDSLSE